MCVCDILEYLRLSINICRIDNIAGEKSLYCLARVKYRRQMTVHSCRNIICLAALI